MPWPQCAYVHFERMNITRIPGSPAMRCDLPGSTCRRDFEGGCWKIPDHMGPQNQWKMPPQNSTCCPQEYVFSKIFQRFPIGNVWTYLFLVPCVSELAWNDEALPSLAREFQMCLFKKLPSTLWQGRQWNIRHWYIRVVPLKPPLFWGDVLLLFLITRG